MFEHVVINIMQLAYVLLLAPLAKGVLNRMKERLQGKAGPSIFQSYYDLRKLFAKDEIVSEQSSWIFRAAPYVAFIAPLLVTLLIPVLTDYPLFMAFMADMVGAGFILALSGLFTALAAVDTANPYGAMGASRTRMVGFLVEPVFMMIFFAVSFTANSTIPYIVQQQWVSTPAAFFEPAHLLLVVAMLMIILAETGKIPVDNPSGDFELAMIDEAKNLEYSGRGAALMHWAGAMKLVVLLTVLLNVLLAPWGLASKVSIGAVLLAVPLIALKMLIALAVLAVIEVSFAKLRLFRIPEFLGAAFAVAAIAMIARVFLP
ncbi:NADH-quinone oxidoreductase subunit H [Metallibacterium sp.]|uniref:Respiratory-chain NADH dehydrogenase, subunit 1 n=1 Tax=mine drainage metagenome TaxID=410659 RepID=T1B2U2_9ZZZZ|nr:NADH-quinone oxidoreductase subunit H [Metallibacterium sp.]